MAELINVGANLDGIDPANRAEDPLIVDRIRNEIIKDLSRIRGDKQGLLDEWAACFDCWNQKQRVRLYDGASDLYLPVGRNIVETFVAQIKGQILPLKLFVEQNDAALGPSPEAVGSLLRHFIEQANVPRYIEPLIRNALIYGTAIVKFPWVQQFSNVYRRRPLIPPELAGMVDPALMTQTTVVKEPVRVFNGPAFRVIDPMRFFADPITCTEIDQCSKVFEDIDVSYAHLQDMEKAGIYFDVKRLKEQGAKDNGDTEAQRNERLARSGITINKQGGGSAHGDGYKGLHTISEIWCNYDLDGTGEEMPCKIVVCGDVVLEARPNPFFLQRAPYRVWKLIDMPDSFFGQGMVTGLKHMNYAVNALINQGVDSAVFQTNPVIIANHTALAQGMGAIKFAHKSVIYTNTKPSDAVEVVKIPDSSGPAFQTASLIMQSMRDLAGAPPILQGQMGEGTGNTTATESSILQQNASSGVDNFVDALESSILTPMLRDWYLLTQQMLDDEVYIQLAQEPKFPMSANDLVGDYRFRWLLNRAIANEAGMMQERMVTEQLQMAEQGQGAMMDGAIGDTPAESGGQPLAPNSMPPR